MTALSRVFWEVARRLVALLCWAVAGWWIWSGVAGVTSHRPKSIGEFLFAVFFGMFIVLLALGLAWLGWRLWFRWNEATICWSVGTILAFGIIFIAGSLPHWLRFPDADLKASAIPTVATVPLLIIAALVFRRLTRVVARMAGLNEVLDIYDQRTGHTDRVKFFATVLGWSIWLGGMALSDWISNPPRKPDIDGIFILASIVLGYGTYKFILWSMAPHTKPALPVQQAFEVVIKNEGEQ